MAGFARPVLLGLGLALLSVLIPSLSLPALAQSKQEEARALFEKGVSASDAGHWAEAADAFTRSLALVERPSTLFNLTLALHEQGRFREGVKAGARYLELVPKDAEPAQRRRIEQLVSDMRAAMGTLVLRVEPADARVLVDGESIPQAEYGAIALLPGQHAVLVHDEGYGTHEEKVVVEKQVRTMLLVRLTAPQGQPVATGDKEPRVDQAEIDLRVRRSALVNDITRAREVRELANRRKPLILTGIGGGLVLAGVLMATTSDDPALMVPGIAASISGGGMLLAGGISGLVRRGKRGYYQRRIDKYQQEIDSIDEQLELRVGARPGALEASLTLSF